MGPVPYIYHRTRTHEMATVDDAESSTLKVTFPLQTSISVGVAELVLKGEDRHVVRVEEVAGDEPPPTVHRQMDRD